MFTGIITHTGKVSSVTKKGLSIKVPKSLHKKMANGDSISVNGICLTVTSHQSPVTSIGFNLMPETIKKTNLKTLKKNTIVNLELPATAQTFLSGHIVQGHVDGVGQIVKIQKNRETEEQRNRRTEKQKNNYLITIKIPKNIHKYFVEKGSVAVNGVSLTIIKISKNAFTVGIIPHTAKATNLGALRINDAVNIEVDIISKYIYSYAKNSKAQSKR